MNEDFENVCVELRGVRRELQRCRVGPWTICLGIWLFLLTNAALAMLIGLVLLVAGMVLNRVGR